MSRSIPTGVACTISALTLLFMTESLLMPTANAAPQTGVPALLQFAENYQQQSPAPQTNQTPAKAKQSAAGIKPDKTEQKKSQPGLRWQTQETELRRQQATITRLEKQVSSLQAKLTAVKKTPETAPPEKLPNLGVLAQGLRHALLTLAEKQATTQLQQQVKLAQATEKKLRADNADLINQLTALKSKNQASETQKLLALTTRLQAVEQDKATLQTHLSAAKKNDQDLALTNEDLKDQLARATKSVAALRDSQTTQQRLQGELQQQRVALQTEVDGKVTELANLKAAMTALQKSAPTALNADSLKQPSVRQDYAAGVSLGEEILQMQTERQKWGVKVNKNTLLAGLVDTFAGQRQLDEQALNQALSASELQVAQAREKVLSLQKKQGEAYVAAFKNNKRVKTTPSGAWYRLDYAGDTVIPAGATLDVVVKEMLTDGTVIQDMETSGALLSQPLDRFPPVFQSALQALRNHGSLTLVVPPALAYGEKGYPPNVPPNATMVYTLRVTDVYPPASKAVAASATAQ